MMNKDICVEQQMFQSLIGKVQQNSQPAGGILEHVSIPHRKGTTGADGLCSFSHGMVGFNPS